MKAGLPSPFVAELKIAVDRKALERGEDGGKGPL